YFANLGVKENFDVLLCFYSPRKIARHLGEIVAADDEQHLGSAIRKEYRSLTSRIAAPSDDDSCPATNLTFERSRSVINAHTLKLFAPLRIQPAVICAGCDQETLRSQHRPAPFDLKTSGIFISAVV